MMKPLRFAIFVSALALLAPPAQAITFATGAGTDNAGCGAVTAPCRTLQQAVTNTPAGGYVVLQGPSDFGPAEIGKSISIVGEGGAAIKANAGAGGLRISTSANQFVRLSGLTITSAGFGTTGVLAMGGAHLEVANCIIRNFGDEGIFVTPTFIGAKIFASIVDTKIENASAGFVARKPSSIDANVSAYLDGVQARRNQFGFALAYEGGRAAHVVVVNSLATENSTAGFLGTQRWFPLPQLPPDAGLIVVRSVASGNGAGVLSSASDVDGIVSLSHSVITGNASANGATKLAHSFGGNVIRGNADDTVNLFASQALH